mmetsp:Transcript_8670/g.15205  ORF Transcript_8670/g.15205 Transcript_8670/m.15205 type:complete len:487 (-) Transcript_8670:44-1504(-)
MDTASKKEAREAQIRDCPNCARFEKLRLRSSMVSNANFHTRFNMGDGYAEDKQNPSYAPGDASYDYEESENIGLDILDTSEEPPNKALGNLSARTQAQLLHTRHMSIDIVGNMGNIFGSVKPTLRRSGSGDGMPPPIDEATPFLGTTARPSNVEAGIPQNSGEMRSFDESYSSSSTNTESSSFHPNKPMTRVKAAKFVFLTMKEALVNSSFIIAGGSVGFYFIEDMSAVDSFYFTTVLLTSVGYGDIVPVTTAGKLFASIFVIVAGTVLLHNMTLISMIPLELRKRRMEHAVLEQFGNQLTDDDLRELSTGRLINRLKLATNRPDGLEECNREMFSLAMLVRLGRITEHDVKATFAAFRRLDVGNYGKLNSRTIIEGEIMRRKSLRNLVALSALSPPEQWAQPTQHYSRESLSQGPSYHAEYSPPDPFRSSTNGSFSRNSSMGSYYSQGVVSGAPSFDYDAYERWASNFDQYSPSPPSTNNNTGAY